MSQVTDMLGTADSRLGNIVLGSGAPASVVPIVVSANNVLVLSQSVTRNTVLNLGANHSLNLGQTSGRVQELDTENTIVFDEEVTYNYGKFVDALNSLTFDQDVAAQKEVMRSVGHTLVMTQGLSRNLIRVLSPSHTFNITQTVLAFNTKYTSNTFVIGQSVAFFKAKIAKNVIEYTQSVALNTVLTRSLNSVFGVFHSVQIGPNTFRRTVEQTLNLGQVAIGYAVRGVNQTITFVQNVVVNRVKGAESAFVLSQNVNLDATFNRSASSTIAFTQTVAVNKIKLLTAQSIFAPIQNVKKTKIITATAENNFGLSQELVKSRYFRDLSQTLTFSQLAEHQRIATPSVPATPVVFQQEVKLNKVLNLSCGNVLQFKSSFTRRVEIGNQHEVIVPEVQVVVVKNLVVLRGSDYAITLPAPEFDDSEAFTGSINIIRFKTGGKTVYKKDTDKRVLEYTFVLQRKKVNELKYFINRFNATPFYLENWKGELWYVMFNSNPFVFTEESYWENNTLTGDNKFTIPLSFQGVRLN